MDATLQNAKIELIQWLTMLEDNTLIGKIMQLRNSTSQDWWDTATDEDKNAIELRIKDSIAGKLNPNSAA